MQDALLIVVIIKQVFDIGTFSEEQKSQSGYDQAHNRIQRAAPGL